METINKISWEIRGDIGIITLDNPPENYLVQPEFVPLDTLRKWTSYDYLKGIAQKLAKKGIQSRIVVLIGNVADEIVDYAKDEEADLIIMASRGRTGMSRWDVANAAPKVFRETDIPVLMVKPPAGFKETKARRKGKAA